MKKQFWLIGICILGILAACNRKPKDGLTDTYTSGVIAIAADESSNLSSKRRLMCLREFTL